MKPYYQDTHCVIYHGDNREILPALGRFDLILMDPPYGIGENNIKGNSRSTGGKGYYPNDYGKFDWDKQPASREMIDACLAIADKAIIWGGNYFHLPPSKAWLVWDKINSCAFADCELAWTNLNQAVRLIRFMWNGMLRDGEARGVKRVHPTQKPVELMTWCLSFAPDAKTVIDPYLGAGSTMIAAKMLGKTCIGIEKEERYCEAAASRLSQTYLQFPEPEKPQPKESMLFVELSAARATKETKTMSNQPNASREA